VNCAAIPEHLVESELFGYEKGAFSGADTLKTGYFEMPITERFFSTKSGLRSQVQVKLLRVLDGVPYYRLAAAKSSVDVRVVAATNQNLEELVRSGRFAMISIIDSRSFTLEVPPLRERPEDLLGIAEQILHQHYPNSRFTSDAVKAMLSYNWPGNVRELRNCIFRAVMVAKSAHFELTAEDLKLQLTVPQGNGKTPLSRDMDQMERQIILRRWNAPTETKAKAAQALGISRRTLLRKLKSYRENETESTVGSLGAEQQHYYRKETKTPIRMRYADAILTPLC